MEPGKEPSDTHTRSSQRCFPQAGRKRLGSVGLWGKRAQGAPSCFYRIQAVRIYPYGLKCQETLHYRQTYLSFTWKIGGPVTHTVYRKTKNEGKMKRGVMKTRVPHIHSNLEVAYKMEFFSFFIPWHGEHVSKITESEKHHNGSGLFSKF